MADPSLTIAWLILGHLLADFVFQTDGIAFAKAAPGARAWLGLAAHGIVVAALLVPVALAFGAPGALAVVVIAVTHALIDRSKILLTRRAEARALRTGRHEPRGSAGGFVGHGWTPVPAALFIADQLIHAAIIVTAWAIWLADASLTPSWVATVDELLGGWDAAAVHATTLTMVVIAALAVANIRGGAFFVEALVDPRRTADGMSTTPDDAAVGAPLSPAAPRLDEPPASPPRVPGSDVPPPRIVTTRLVRPLPPDRVGATIGVLERLLIVTFILTANQAAVGFVIAAKTLARFKQLDDREFAEYYLLGTLGSVSIAVATGLLAVAALATIPA